MTPPDRPPSSGFPSRWRLAILALAAAIAALSLIAFGPQGLNGLGGFAVTESVATLYKLAEDTGTPPKDRIAALKRLAGRENATAATLAAKLASDPNEDVALVALDLLEGTLAPVPGHGDLLPQSPPLSRLRDAVSDTRAKVRAHAANLLARHSDLQALGRIQDGVARGLFTDIDAVRLIAKANSDIREKYMRYFAKRGSPEAQALAKSYLPAEKE